MIYFNKLDSEALKNQINVQSRGMSLHEAYRENLKFRGSLSWKNINGEDYLYRTIRAIQKSYGRRSLQTEATYAAFTQGKDQLQQRIAGLRKFVGSRAGIIQAHRLGRVPKLFANILQPSIYKRPKSPSSK